jgi:uncharacterized protein (TIGR00369 family)
MSDPTQVLATWHRLNRYPGGKWLFSRLVGRIAPYSGTIGARVEELRPGFARVRMRDRRRVRNPFRSVHAVAMMNLAEMASGLAMMAGLPPDARAILTGLSIDYSKKARGTLSAECSLQPPTSNERKEHVIAAVVRDGAGDEVARAQARWMVGPK